MAEFIDILQQRVNKLAEKVAQYTKNKQIMEETDRKRKELPSKAVTELEAAEIPQLFFLKEDFPTDDELRPRDHELTPS
ncbi:hypothetical protein N7501_010105 [Penicillium viridicatum]|nr:hypothetical protein N7501_010105 [Penicillium viridicatum]